MRTSFTHPLHIDSFPVAQGRLGMTLCPGRKGPSISGPSWDRDLQADTTQLKLWKTDVVLTLTQQDEMNALGVGHMKHVMEGMGLLWYHLPIPDTGIPDGNWLTAWQRIAPIVHQILEAGGRVVIHCRAGLERTALVAALVQCERGESISQALKHIAQSRTGAGPLPRQLQWLQDQRQEDNRARQMTRACLFGGAMGDSLGAEIEFWSLSRIRKSFPRGVDRILYHDGCPAAITDDTQMTLFTAEGLLQHNNSTEHSAGLVTQSVHQALIRWLTTQGQTAPIPPLDWTGLVCDPRLHHRRAPGTTCLSSLIDAKNYGDFARNNSKGCGAIMRVAPIALCGSDEADTLADQCSHLTHAHPTGRDAARAQAHFLKQLLKGGTLEEALHSLDTLRLNDETRAAIHRAWHAAPDKRPETVETLGQGWVAEEALSIALYAARVAESFEEGLSIAVTHSGDSDSTGAIAGNLLGLLYPDEVLSHPWRVQIECADLIDRIASELHDRRCQNEEVSRSPFSVLTQASETGKPYLGDMETVSALILNVFNQAGDVLAHEDNGEITRYARNKVIDALIAPLAAGFAGVDQASFTPIGAWNGEPLAIFLQQHEKPSVFDGVDIGNPHCVVAAVLNAYIAQFSKEIRAHFRGKMTLQDVHTNLSATVQRLTWLLMGLPLQTEEHP